MFLTLLDQVYILLARDLKPPLLAKPLLSILPLKTHDFGQNHPFKPSNLSLKNSTSAPLHSSLNRAPLTNSIFSTFFFCKSEAITATASGWARASSAQILLFCVKNLIASLCWFKQVCFC